MRIAVVGGGISGLVCAYLLAPVHEVVLFEKEPRLGGHTHTVDVSHEGRTLAVDTGFIVFNERNYPNFCALLARLGVRSRPTTMSFSVRDDAAGFEYGGSSLAGVVGSWGNLASRRWWGVVRGVASLGRRGKSLLASMSPDATLADLCASGAMSGSVLEDYLVPMAGAIWSAPRRAVRALPARFLLRFFDNHGMLDLRERPRWRTIEGGSRRYIDAMMGVIARCVRAGAGVASVERREDRVMVRGAGGEESFDHVVLATHADQTLAMLADASEQERGVLRDLPYQANLAVLHTDQSVLPRRRRCWAAWNARLTPGEDEPVSVTYNMTMLQGLETRTPVCVTLNDVAGIDPSRVLGRYTYHHPVHTVAGERARERWQEISGVRRTHFCGAYWGNGFHEDGVVSALRVCRALGVAP
ncbi:MAG: NAD(P)-binding protein [Planctomycetota bacterium]|nr:NAD(P)-binding protein [Planctomycetota bacterium]